MTFRMITRVERYESPVRRTKRWKVYLVCGHSYIDDLGEVLKPGDKYDCRYAECRKDEERDADFQEMRERWGDLVDDGYGSEDWP
jgi:hypothetical protein